ncbi:MAG: tRNA uridine-5-carboxymethylaminomethyl(34) synthesis enzyme MnmG [Pseudomonadota bacterium]|jgi:tRNA uridine 5-carboxymethylaminomethyl modification enzyme
MNNIDVIIVGGGHAAIEAALAASKMGLKVLMLTQLIDRIGAVSCNPAVGGLAKGHLVKEVDALGGFMGIATDYAGIQFRILNESKGSAVRGSRAQIDMDLYSEYAKNIVLNAKNLSAKQETVVKLLIEDNAIYGLETELGNKYCAKSIVLACGTFLDGVVHIGETKLKAGRFGEFAAIGLGAQLRELGFEVGRLKTGTCPRVEGRSIDFSKLDRQEPDANPIPFSFSTPKPFTPNQLPCYIAYTNEITHEIIRSNFYRAPLFTGQIEGVGPRYCPSIEDKINRFADKTKHQLFVEPQTRYADEFYINGMSTSLPIDAQEAMLKSVVGFKNAVISRYGYAIEYDYVQPTELYHTLMTKKIKGLFFAGQINGTTGYEEAAAQGLMAGINAALYAKNEDEFTLGREEAYIGVLIDDLVTKGAYEPYRMFTSRAEYRLLLREDNADIRLTKYGAKYALVSQETYQKVKARSELIDEILLFMKQKVIGANKENIALLERLDEETVNDQIKLIHLAGRTNFKASSLQVFLEQNVSNDILEYLLTEAKYAHYIEKQQKQIEKMKTLIKKQINEDFIYDNIPGLSTEVVEKLKKAMPKTLFHASEISGVTPAALDILAMRLAMNSL